MRLAEAILLGSTMGLPVSNYSWRTCLLGIGLAALGKDNICNREALIRYPWVGKEYLIDGQIQEFRSYITGLAMKVETGEMTIDKAAELIDSVDPTPRTKEVESEAASVQEKETICDFQTL